VFFILLPAVVCHCVPMPSIPLAWEAFGLSVLHSTQIKELIKGPRKYGEGGVVSVVCALSPTGTHADWKTWGLIIDRE
jgi:hypothetical protein